MKGIILLNRQFYSVDVKGEVELLHDAGKLLHFAKEHQIELVKPNPNQLNTYYTNPFALHYDLKKGNASFDCLLIHSAAHFENLQIDYEEYWDVIKSHFAFVTETELHEQQEISLSADDIQDLPPISNL